MVNKKSRSPAEELCHEDYRCIVAVHGIKRFGFRAKRILADHYATFGTVQRVCIATFKTPGNQVRPGNFGLVLMGDRNSVTKILEEGAQKTILGVAIKVEACRHLSTNKNEPFRDLQDIPQHNQAIIDGNMLHQNNRHQANRKEPLDTSQLWTGPSSSSQHGPAAVRSVEQQTEALDTSFSLSLASCLRNLARFGPVCEQGRLMSQVELLQMIEMARFAQQGLHIFSQQLACRPLHLSRTNPHVWVDTQKHLSHLLTMSTNLVSNMMSELELSETLSQSDKETATYELAMAAQGVISTAQDVLGKLQNTTRAHYVGT